MSKIMNFASGGAYVSIIEIIQVLESRFSFVREVEVLAGGSYVLIVNITLTNTDGVTDSVRFELYFKNPSNVIAFSCCSDEFFEQCKAEILITLSVQFGGTFSVSEKFDTVKTVTTVLQIAKSNELINKLYDTSENNKRQHKP